MAVTLKQIAELAGVSRGTVDRALNDRGRIDKEVSARIKKIAKELGYTPNRAGRALALYKNPVKIGVIVQAIETPFMKTVLQGIEKAMNEVKGLGIEVILKETEYFSEEIVLQKIDELLLQNINGLALIATDGEKLKAKIDEIQQHNIPVVTFNSDLDNSKRMCFIGLDNYLSGQASAGIMSDLIGFGKILIITGYPTHRSHNMRVLGFCDEIKRNYADLDVLTTEFCYDNDLLAEQIVKKCIENNKDIKGIFVPSNGQIGVCNALIDLKINKQVKLICYDVTPNNIKHLKDDNINFLIDQNGLEQGYTPIIVLSDYFLSDVRPKSEYIYTDIVIKTKYIT